MKKTVETYQQYIEGIKLINREHIVQHYIIFGINKKHKMIYEDCTQNILITFQK